MRAHRTLFALVVLASLLVVPAGAGAFSQPQQLHSKNGVLRATFVARFAPAKIDGKLRTGAMTYNKQYIGPTLNVRPGDRIELSVKNELNNETNLHFHGMHVSPAGNSDNVLRRFMPQKTYKISVKIPHDHPNGLYWYHPHLHTQVNDQVFRGMAGLIVVKGGDTDMKSLDKYKERQLALSLVQYNPGGDSLINPNDQNDPTAQTIVNGRSNQTIKMKPGAVERWRIANVSNEGFMKLQLQGHKVWLVGQDGNPMAQPHRVSTVTLAPGGRMEVLVKADKTGKFKLRQVPYFDGFNQFQPQDLLTLDVSGSKTKAAPLPKKLRKFEDLSKAKVGTRRTWTLSFSPDNAPTFTAMINGKTFSPDRIDTRAKIGEVEEWTFVNQTTQMHPLHIHTNDFQIVKVNGKKRKALSPIDDAIVPAMGSLTVRFKPLSYTGTAVFHCHILFHEDVGMMATIKFVKGEASSTVVRAANLPSVEEEAVATQRVLDVASVQPISQPPGHTAEHVAHARSVRYVPGVTDHGGGPGGANWWLYCRLNS